jgi:hypothetical protein
MLGKLPEKGSAGDGQQALKTADPNCLKVIKEKRRKFCHCSGMGS